MCARIQNQESWSPRVGGAGGLAFLVTAELAGMGDLCTGSWMVCTGQRFRYSKGWKSAGSVIQIFKYSSNPEM